MPPTGRESFQPARQGFPRAGVQKKKSASPGSEHSIECGELCAHSVADIILIDHRFRIDPDISERGEDGLESTGLGLGAAARYFGPAPNDADAAEATCGLRHEKGFHGMAMASSTLSTRYAAP